MNGAADTNGCRSAKVLRGSRALRRWAKTLLLTVVALAAAAGAPEQSPAYITAENAGFLADPAPPKMSVTWEEAHGGGPEMRISAEGTPTDPVPEGTQGSFTLQIPPTTKMTAFKLDLACNSTDGWQSGLYYRIGSGGFDGLVPGRIGATSFVGTLCSPGEAGEIVDFNSLSSFPTQNVTGLRLLSRCVKPGGCTAQRVAGTPGYLHANYARVTLEDPVGPTISLPNPGLFAGGPQSGTVITTPRVTDEGSGVAWVEARVDENVVRPNDLRCRNWAARQCDETVDFPFSVDTSTLAPGDHTVSLKVRDYEGNIEVRSQAFTTVAPPRAVVPPEPAAAMKPTVRGASVPVPDLRARPGWSRARLSAEFSYRDRNASRVLTAGYHAKPLVTGRLIGPSGRPIAGASIDAAYDVKPPWEGVTTSGFLIAGPIVKTDSRGRYRIRVHPMQSTTVAVWTPSTVAYDGARVDLEFLSRASITIERPRWTAGLGSADPSYGWTAQIGRPLGFLGIEPRPTVVVQTRERRRWHTKSRTQAVDPSIVGGDLSSLRQPIRLRIAIPRQHNWPYVRTVSRAIRMLPHRR